MLHTSVFLTNKVHVLKRADNTSLGFVYAGAHTRTSYILSFPSIAQALHVSKHVNDPRKIRMSRHVTTNLLANASAAQREYWQRLHADGGISSDAVHVNFNALIHLSKSPVAMPVTDMCTIQPMPIEDFLQYPFTHNIGIALLRSIQKETPDEIIAEAVVLEANTNTHDFHLRSSR